MQRIMALYDTLKLGEHTSKEALSFKMSLYSDESKTHRICLPQQLDRTTFKDFNVDPVDLKELILKAFENKSRWGSIKLNRNINNGYAKDKAYAKGMYLLLKHNLNSFIDAIEERIKEYGTLSNEYVFRHCGLNPLHHPSWKNPNVPIPEINFIGLRRCCAIKPRAFSNKRYMEIRKKTEIILNKVYPDNKRYRDIAYALLNKTQIMVSNRDATHRLPTRRETALRKEHYGIRCTNFSTKAVCDDCLGRIKALEQFYYTILQYERR